jgi:hypothetical protein
MKNIMHENRVRQPRAMAVASPGALAMGSGRHELGTTVCVASGDVKEIMRFFLYRMKDRSMCYK